MLYQETERWENLREKDEEACQLGLLLTRAFSRSSCLTDFAYLFRFNI